MANDNSGFDWSSMIGPAAAIGTGVIGRAMAPSASQATQAQIPPELRTLLGQSVQRTQYQNPLFQATSNQAFQGLPAYAREGLSMPSSMGTMPNPAGGSGGDQSSMLAQLLKYLAAGGAGFAAGKAGSGGSMDIGKLLGDIFGGHGGFGDPMGVVGDPGSGPAGNWLPSYDPFSANPFSGQPNDPMGFPSDPSGGSGVGPGMQQFYDNGGGGGADPNLTQADGTWGEW